MSSARYAGPEAIEVPARIGVPAFVPPQQPVVAAAPPAEAVQAADAPEDIKRIGPIEISHGLYTVFLNEADECDSHARAGRRRVALRTDPRRPASDRASRTFACRDLGRRSA